MGTVLQRSSVLLHVDLKCPRETVSAVGGAQSGVQEPWAGDVKWKDQHTHGFEVKRRLDREDDAGLSPSAS